MLIKLVINILLLLVLAKYIPGIHVSNLYIATIVIILWSIANIFIKPLLMLLSLPIQIITFGLFTIVINAAIAFFIASFVQGFDLATFKDAIILALSISLLNVLLSLFK